MYVPQFAVFSARGGLTPFPTGRKEGHNKRPPYLHQLIQDHCIEAGQVLHIVPLHHWPVFPDMCSQLFHIKYELSYVPAREIQTRFYYCHINLYRSIRLIKYVTDMYL